jgi:tetraacyldisaccharide 4'-kinase
MDDGFQNPSLRKDRSILVVDGRRGIGNGRVFPAGPLRAPLQSQLRRAQALLLIGEGPAGDHVATDAQAHGLPVFHARLVPDAPALAALKDKPVLAFTGIGDPQKFFGTLTKGGIDVRAAIAFADHHRYRPSEASDLIRRAEREGLAIVTTEKDQARLTGQDNVAALLDVAQVLPITIEVTEQKTFRDWVLG